MQRRKDPQPDPAPAANRTRKTPIQSESIDSVTSSNISAYSISTAIVDGDFQTSNPYLLFLHDLWRSNQKLTEDEIGDMAADEWKSLSPVEKLRFYQTAYHMRRNKDNGDSDVPTDSGHCGMMRRKRKRTRSASCGSRRRRAPKKKCRSQSRPRRRKTRSTSRGRSSRSCRRRC